MKKKLENLYYKSPVFLQNMAVTGFGYRLKKERYGKSSDRYLQDLEKSERLNENEMQAQQCARFLKILRHCLTTVPYYKKWLKRENATLDDFTSVSDLKYFPVTDKEMLRSNSKQFLSDNFRSAKDLIRVDTSGTTGTPVSIYCNRDGRTHHYAFWRRLRNWFGVNHLSKRATLFGRVIMSPDCNKPPFWRLDRCQNIMLMSSYHLAESNIAAYISALRRFGPSEVLGFPSSIYRLARYIVDRNLDPLRPKVVITTAESLLPYQRDAIESAFDCPLVNQYGCSEMLFFASQCEFGRMHVHLEHGIVELLDKAQNEVPNGSLGEVVATGLINPVMPLVRYKIGDLATLSSNTCQCSRKFPILESIDGRNDDVIKTPDGTPVGRLDPIKGRKGIIETQIAQIAKDELEVRIVTNREYHEKVGEEIIRELELRVGTRMVITIVTVKEIPRNSAGKFKAVKCEYE